jgi:predicted thioesterase
MLGAHFKPDFGLSGWSAIGDAAFKALNPYCEGDEITVGTAINIEHRAASGIGARIRAEAIVEPFDGRFYTVRVSANDNTREVGRGTVGRAVVSVRRFMQNVKKESGAQ